MDNNPICLNDVTGEGTGDVTLNGEKYDRTELSGDERTKASKATYTNESIGGGKKGLLAKAGTDGSYYAHSGSGKDKKYYKLTPSKISADAKKTARDKALTEKKEAKLDKKAEGEQKKAEMSAGKARAKEIQAQNKCPNCPPPPSSFYTDLVDIEHMNTTFYQTTDGNGNYARWYYNGGHESFDGNPALDEFAHDVLMLALPTPMKSLSLATNIGSKLSQMGIRNLSLFTASAEKVWGNGLTVVGRALQKHAGRAGSAFQKVKFSGKTANADAAKIVEEIMNSSNQVIKAAEQGGYEVYDTVSGMGFAVSREGLFNGFRELSKSK